MNKQIQCQEEKKRREGERGRFYPQMEGGWKTDYGIKENKRREEKNKREMILKDF